MNSSKAKKGFVNVDALRSIKHCVQYLGVDETVRMLKKIDADEAYIGLAREMQIVTA